MPRWLLGECPVGGFCHQPRVPHGCCKFTTSEGMLSSHEHERHACCMCNGMVLASTCTWWTCITHACNIITVNHSNCAHSSLHIPLSQWLTCSRKRPGCMPCPIILALCSQLCHQACRCGHLPMIVAARQLCYSYTWKPCICKCE